LLHDANYTAAANKEDIGLSFNKLRRIFRDQLRVLPKNTVIDREVLAVNKATASQIIYKKHRQRVLPRERK
jgi:hypothetical protein